MDQKSIAGKKVTLPILAGKKSGRIKFFPRFFPPIRKVEGKTGKTLDHHEFGSQAEGGEGNESTEHQLNFVFHFSPRAEMSRGTTKMCLDMCSTLEYPSKGKKIEKRTVWSHSGEI